MSDRTSFWHLPESVEKILAPVLRVSHRKYVLFLICLAVLGLALMLFGRTPTTGSGSQATTPPAASQSAGTAPPGDAERLAGELADILGQISGAGKVSVRLTLAATAANQWEQNRRHTKHTEEDRSQDGRVLVTTEETDENTLALVRRPDGSEAPVEEVTTAPQVAGAIIVAAGAGDAAVKAEIARAAAAFLGVGLHRITVFAGEAHEDDLD